MPAGASGGWLFSWRKQNQTKKKARLGLIPDEPLGRIVARGARPLPNRDVD